MPLLPEFSRRYPGVTVDLHLDDRFADLVEDSSTSRSATGGSTTATLSRDSWRRCSSSYAVRRKTLRAIPSRIRRMICRSVAASTFGWRKTGPHLPVEFEEGGQSLQPEYHNGRLIVDDRGGCLPCCAQGHGPCSRSQAPTAVPPMNAGRVNAGAHNYITRRRARCGLLIFNHRRHLRGASGSLLISSATDIHPRGSPLPSLA